MNTNQRACCRAPEVPEVIPEGICVDKIRNQTDVGGGRCRSWPLRAKSFQLRDERPNLALRRGYGEFRSGSGWESR